MRSGLTLEDASECVLRAPGDSFGTRGEAVAGDIGTAFMRDDKVCPRTGGGRLPSPVHDSSLPLLIGANIYQGSRELEDQFQNLEKCQGPPVLDGLGEALKMSEHFTWGTDVR